jgi:hypothetical protein
MHRSEREHHTKAGWWIMTHERGGAAIIGASACLVLALDLLYVAARWDGFAQSFGRGFAFGFGSLILAGLIAWALGVRRPTSTRQDARRRASGNNLLFVVVILAFVFAIGHYSGSEAAALLGTVAALSLFFSLACLQAIRLR